MTIGFRRCQKWHRAISHCCHSSNDRIQLYIHVPLLDPTINCDYGDLKSIANLSDLVCISDFHFCKDHLQKIANVLCPLMNVYLLGEKDDIKVEHGY
jgi:hypothetical protein